MLCIEQWVSEMVESMDGVAVTYWVVSKVPQRDKYSLVERMVEAMAASMVPCMADEKVDSSAFGAAEN
jgi:hypothetical protein